MWILTALLLGDFVDNERKNEDDDNQSDTADDDKHPRITGVIGDIHFYSYNKEDKKKIFFSKYLKIRKLPCEKRAPTSEMVSK